MIIFGSDPEASYVTSKFLRESEIDDMTDSKIETVYSNLFNLEELFERKSIDEVIDLLDVHYFCSVPSTESKEDDNESVGTEVNSSTDSTDGDKELEEAEKNILDSYDSEVQDKLDELMKDL